MGEFRFSAAAPRSTTTSRITSRGGRWLTAKILVPIVIIAIAGPLSSRSGTVTFTSPADGLFTDARNVTVTGTVAGTTARYVRLDINGTGHDVPVVDKGFEWNVTLAPGTTTVQPVVISRAFISDTNQPVLKIHCVANPGPMRLQPPVIFEGLDTEPVTLAGEFGLSPEVSNHRLGRAALQVNDRSIDVDVTEGSFRQSVRLQYGRNSVRGVSVDPDAWLLDDADDQEVFLVGPDLSVAFENPMSGLTTTQPVIEVSGVVRDPKTTQLPKVQLTVNDKPSGTCAVDADGRFRGDATLVEGANSIVAAVGSKSASITIVRVSEPGTIDIQAPQDNQTLYRNVTELSGTIENPAVPSAMLTLRTADGTLAGEQLLHVIPNNQQRGEFSQPELSLLPGTNRLNVSVGAIHDQIRVSAPSLWHNFEEGTSDWRLQSGNHLDQPPRHNFGDNSALAMKNPQGPLDLVFLIDVSDSMEDELPELKRQLKAITAEMNRRGDTRIGVVTFANGATLHTKMTGSDSTVNSGIDRLSLGGGVKGGEPHWLGVQRSLESQTGWRSRDANPDVKQMIVVFTDEGDSSAATMSKPETSEESTAGPSLPSIEDVKADWLSVNGVHAVVHFVLYDPPAEFIASPTEPDRVTDAESLAGLTGGKWLSGVEKDTVAKRLLRLIDGTTSQKNRQSWVAPQNLLDRIRGGEGSVLSFEMKRQSNSDAANSRRPLAGPMIEAHSANKILQHECAAPVDHNGWIRFDVSLIDSAQWLAVNERRENSAVDEQTLLHATLRSLELLRIQSAFTFNGEKIYLDNVVLTGPPFVADVDDAEPEQ